MYIFCSHRHPTELIFVIDISNQLLESIDLLTRGVME
jgi:hypothetical protein